MLQLEHIRCNFPFLYCGRDAPAVNPGTHVPGLLFRTRKISSALPRRASAGSAAAITGLGDYYTSQYYAWASYDALIHQRDYETAVDYGVAAVQLQPGNVLANLNLGYACLYAGYYDDCDQLLTWVAGLGGGLTDAIRLDLDAQARSGLRSAHTDALLALLP